jgi:RNA 3'-terminal phosphate cyclase (ATP)
MAERITIDGSQGEGGGQILRTALALSLATGTPFRVEQIRAGRQRPGLLRQHLTAVQAAVAIGGAQVSGAELGSTWLDFAPNGVRAGEYQFTIGTAGSATLVLQAVLPALLTAGAPTRLTLEGGTHNPFAPSFDFIELAFLPLLRTMGANVRTTFERHGFYPAGGGRFTVEVEPCRSLARLTLLDRGDTTMVARAMVASLPQSIANRELDVVSDRLGLERRLCRIDTIASSDGPGNVVIVELRSPEVTEIVTGFGVKGVSAETVAHDVCEEVRAYVAAGVPIGRHVADQILLPMALGGGGVFRTVTPTPHTVTNVEVIRKFLNVPIALEDEGAGAWRIEIGGPAQARIQ